MEIGERITEIRKKVHLSQEAFGESLGVSRQAISKWESGSTVPEVEKLIQISKLYSTPVGWILGVDEKSESTDLNETQLEMVKEIVKQYTETASSAPQNDIVITPVKRRKLPYIIIILAVIVFAVWCGGLSDKLSELQNQYTNIQNQVYNLQSSLNTQTSDLTQRIEDILDAQNSVLADYGYSISSYDLYENTVDIEAYIIPKIYTDKMCVEFTTDSDGTIVTITAAEEEAHKFTAKITCPLTDMISISASIVSSENTETQLLGNLVNELSNSFPDCFFTASPWLIFNDTETVSESGIHDRFELIQNGKKTSSGQKVDVSRVEFIVLLNNKPQVSFKGVPQQDHYSIFWSTDCSFKFPVNEGDTINYAAVITDSYGRKFVVSETGFQVENGEFTYTEYADTSFDFLKEQY